MNDDEFNHCALCDNDIKEMIEPDDKVCIAPITKVSKVDGDD